MKHNWTYKKLGEVANIYQPKTLSTEMLIADGKYLVYGANGVIGRYSEYNHEEKELLVTCRGATCGTLNVSEPFSWINGNAMVVHISDNQVLFDFLKYVLKGLDWSLIITGAAQPQITRQNLAPTKIPIPSLDEQQTIVRELDGINRLIDLQEEQLCEYDRLAQSLFYTTFGDPVSNPKGWEVKKLGEISTLLNGRAYSKNELLNKGKYRILRVGNFFTNDSWYYSDLELDADKYCDKGDLLFAWSASFCARIWEGEKVIYHYHIWKVLCDETQLDKVFYCHLLNYMLESMKKDTHGTGMVHLTKIGMEQYYLPLPPLALQQSFAAQIEAIEQQKALIRRSLDETRTLLAARMQYYFNS